MVCGGGRGAEGILDQNFHFFSLVYLPYHNGLPFICLLEMIFDYSSLTIIVPSRVFLLFCSI